jgi:formate hydrogenlyase subunit 3/multisubunit Na+/H+ antiporter MnhD subunit
MVWFLTALAILLAGGLFSLAVGGSPKAACLIGAAGALLGGAVVLFQSLEVLVSGQSQSLRLAWPLSLVGSANMEIDPLSAVFAAAIALVTMLAAIYGSGYLQRHAGRKNLGVSWFFFNLLTASMLLVVAARNGVLFLINWELMSLSSFFLMILEDEKESVRRAGWIYLVAMHLGTAFLLALFLLLGKNAGSLDFERLSTAAAPGGVFFLLAVIGFGTKAGFIPMHVWLPEAHPAAPSHVSAVMSGVMIKTGIYGLLRMLTLLGTPPPWWGWTFVIVGVVSGVLGVLYALSQHDLKRLLAYHSVENIGIIAMGLGVGVLGISYNNPTMATLGFSGALLHVVNHALFKSLLFLGAGSVLHAAGTGELDRLGGLLKRMPVTGTTFLIGAAAISGLPPLNGFVSEFLIFLGAIAGLGSQPHDAPAWPLMGVMVVGGLALIGGLAAACFTKAFGIVFLGEPRSGGAAHAHEVGAAMRWPMVVLASLCVLIGLAAPLWPQVLQPAVAVITRQKSPLSLRERARVRAVGEKDAGIVGRGAQGPYPLPLSQRERGDIAALALGPLTGVVLGSYILLALIVLLVGVRRKLLAGRRVEQTVTWDCGYVAPTPRMQYTASSFARPLTQLFRLFLQPRDEIHPPRGLFPKQAALHTHTPDLFRRYVYEPLFLGVAWTASKLRWLQEGRIQIYVLYIALTILVLLIWKLG